MTTNELFLELEQEALEEREEKVVLPEDVEPSEDEVTLPEDSYELD